MNASATSVPELKAAIADYARTRPNSADTAKGIRDWWVESASTPIALILEALGELEREGVIVRRLASGGTEMWVAVPRDPD